MRLGFCRLSVICAVLAFSFAETRARNRSGDQPAPRPTAEDTSVPRAALLPQANGADGTLVGTWRGDDWGEVRLMQLDRHSYEGVYTDTFGNDVGKLSLNWSTTNQRFDGSWGEGIDRHGQISVRLLSDGRTVRGAYTTDLSCRLHPGTPSLADLEWRRVPQEAPGEADAQTVHADDRLRKILNWQPEDTTQHWDADSSLWLRELVLEMKTIQPGTTRGRVDRLFVSDGPTRTAKAHRYQHQNCPFIKLDVFFDVEDDSATEAPDDTVQRVVGPVIDVTSNWQRW